ncbi:chorismate--pyruvate lyase family protein [Nitrincola lacisaponensis]|uniref:chorismate--pyruvate lyase family protein n=1 Tax=Nitrincola lacisaponensis TaxID=267850 RepID=UPI00068C1F66|nr:chorismate lyase [Nitrincola lacisaponensis]
MKIRTLYLRSQRRRHWLAASRRPPLSAHWRDWLCQRESLTQSLILASQGQFQVRLLRLSRDFPSRDEACVLGIPPHRRVLIREVELMGKNQVWVYARSVVPDATLSHCHQALHQLGNRSLGSLLFSDPRIRRGAIQVTHLRDGKEVYPARRSVFYLDTHPLLVTEVFLPVMASVPRR